ncbi:class-II aminoacyl-tRNA synthetase family protein [Marinobacter nauticus]|uniref:hypothetical protein n=1 Tax=Marinobacter nauticus TaxID=2743 RepID=UPI000EAD0A6A|nr:hypothetical protein [Marinobacter nauticus]RKR71474.1 hypothetical protein C7436_3220 [Marinobacter nauticus]
MNESETLVDEILTDLGIEHRKLPELGEPTPDFEIWVESLTSYWEVKEFVENPYEKKVLEGHHEIYSTNSDRIADRVKSASIQFKGYGATDKPCVVVLCDKRDFAVRDLLLIQNVQSAMMGAAEFMKQKDGQVVEVSRRPGLFTNRKEYISAIAVAFLATKELVVLHNPNAAHSLLASPLVSKFKHQYQARSTDVGLSWEKV